MNRRFGLRLCGVFVAVATILALEVPATLASTAADASAPEPAASVDPFVGTGYGPGWIGAIGTFPGAALPFGMVQWSPDTPTSNPNLGVSGGYYYGLTTLAGFSLDHLSGARRTALEDFPVVPYPGAVTDSPVTDPGRFEPTFSHENERASPGYYEVTLNDGVKVELTVTARSGIGRFTFPAGVTPSILVDPEASAGGFSTGDLSVVGDDALSGSAVAGGFCGLPGQYKAHFAAQFSVPFRAEGTWEGRALTVGVRHSSGTAPGVYATFPASAHGPTTVTMKVGLSYTSVADAADNVRVEQHGWDFDAVHQAATGTWNKLLSRMLIRGGSGAQRRVFYTGLYHALLFPSLLSDDDGDYPGLDGSVHVARGSPQYTNISGWDIYRSQVPLLAMLVPKVADGLVTSLVRDADQDGGYLPRWELVNVNENEMGGDSADPIIASAYAFGARGFDVKAALAAMRHGADVALSKPPAGAATYVERPGLAGYLADGFVPTEAGEVTGETDSLSPDMASLTLEYAVDDFSIAQFADAIGEQSTGATFASRSENWRNIFDPATRQMAPKSANGSLPAGWPSTSFDLSDTLAAHGITGVGQLGFQEGDTAQYTWMVPQDLADLFKDVGGRAAATQQLAQFFSQLSAGPTAPYDWAGNEPDLGVPFEADYAGASWLTEKTTSEILDRLYSDSPAGEPGNDDLGAMSSWAVWAMLGVYPETPGTAVLVTTAPTFPSATVELGNGHLLTIHTSKTTPAAGTISAMSLDGRPHQQPWLPAAVASTGGTLGFTLVPHGDTRWGEAPADAPPSPGSSVR